MINSKILASIAIVLIIGAVAAGYQVSQNSETLWKFTNPQSYQDQQPGSSDQSNVHSQSPSTSSSPGTGRYGNGYDSSGGSVVKISSSEAKELANNYIKEKGATAGTPQLITINGKKVYLVPVVINGKVVGEIYIDPVTGENLKGAGGAP